VLQRFFCFGVARFAKSELARMTGHFEQMFMCRFCAKPWLGESIVDAASVI